MTLFLHGFSGVWFHLRPLRKEGRAVDCCGWDWRALAGILGWVEWACFSRFRTASRKLLKGVKNLLVEFGFLGIIYEMEIFSRCR